MLYEPNRKKQGITTATGPSVWTGRPSQAENDATVRTGLALLYPARSWSLTAPGHDGYPRALDLNSRLGPEGQMGHLITNAPTGPFLRHLIPLADLGRMLLMSLSYSAPWRGTSPAT